jgi:hypothetical protein
MSEQNHSYKWKIVKRWRIVARRKGHGRVPYFVVMKFAGYVDGKPSWEQRAKFRSREDAESDKANREAATLLICT